MQAATRSANKDEVIAEERAERKAQKKKETAQTIALKDLLARPKTPTKAVKALVSQKKVVRFDGSDIKEVVAPEPAKRTNRGRAIKTPVIFEQGTN